MCGWLLQFQPPLNVRPGCQRLSAWAGPWRAREEISADLFAGAPHRAARGAQASRACGGLPGEHGYWCRLASSPALATMTAIGGITIATTDMTMAAVTE